MTNSIAPAAAFARAEWNCAVHGHALSTELSPFYIGPPVCGDCGATYSNED